MNIASFTPRLLAAASLALIGTSSQAQTFVPQGEVAAACGNLVGFLDPNGVTTNEYPSASFVSKVLWDPSNPDEFVCAGSTSNFDTGGGFLVRNVLTSASQMVTTMLTPIPSGAFGTPTQISWDSTGDNVIVVTIYDQVHSVNATTGVVTDLTTGSQPWGTDVTCGAMDPATQDVYVGTGSGEIWRLGSGGGPATLFSTVPGSLRRILLGDVDAPRYLHYLTTDRFGRLTLDGLGTTGTYFGALSQPQLGSLEAVTFDLNGGFVFLRSSGDGEIYTLPEVAVLPPAGIAPSYVGLYDVSGSAFTNFARDISVVGATNEPFRLRIEAVQPLGASVRIDNVPQPLGQGWLLFSAATVLPVNSGPMFGIYPDFLTLFILNRTPVPGGLLAFTAPAPTGFDIPPLGMAAFFGQTWDAVCVAFAPNGLYLGRTNVERTTWQ